MTGHRERAIQVGPLPSRDLDEKRMAFDQFTFPACKRCNEWYGTNLEAPVNEIFKQLTDGNVISYQSLVLLLDWFDKVRIGLWLGIHQMLDRNRWEIQPHFYINQRIVSADRVLIIFKAKEQFLRLNWSGVNSAIFAHWPTCFSLMVNNMHFINISADLLLSKRAGLPYVKKGIRSFKENCSIIDCLTNGSGILSPRILNFNYPDSGVVIAQPIFSKFIDFAPQLFTEVAQYPAGSGQGQLIVQSQNQAELLSQESSFDCFSEHMLTLPELYFHIPKGVFEIQRQLLSRYFRAPYISTDQASEIIKSRKSLSRLLSNYISDLDKIIQTKEYDFSSLFSKKLSTR